MPASFSSTELQTQIQKWIVSILADKLEEVAREVEGLKNLEMDPKLNKIVFKAIICLSHSADRAQPSDTQMGKMIFIVSDAMCKFFTEIPDLMKYFSCIYHIVKNLIAMKLFNEAMKITEWSFPGSLVNNLSASHWDMYPKIASLWHTAVCELIDESRVEFITENEWITILKLISSEFRILEVVANTHGQYVICRTLKYLTKLYPPSIKIVQKAEFNHCNIIKAFLSRIDILLHEEKKYAYYHDALRFVNSATVTNVKSLAIENALAVFVDSCLIVEMIFSSDVELSRSILLYRNMGIMLLKPVDSTKKIPHWKFEQIQAETLSLLSIFPNGQGVTWNMRMIGYVMQNLFLHWEQCVSMQNSKFLEHGVLEGMLRFIKLMFSVLNSACTEGCEMCRKNGCTMKKALLTTTIVSSRCIQVVGKISADDSMKKILPLIHNLLEETVAAIFEMKKAGCQQWLSLWNNCAVNIYNLGVTCHKVFYEETAFIFSLLCTCIVRFEGINPVNSALTFKNPLPCILHRLTSVHFNHGYFREAMTPCALNGLLSYQDTDSKAFRTWTNIKQACVGTEEIMKMTMLCCLKEDQDAISEIGVDIKFADYNLREVCLQELLGLQEARCDLSTAMYSVLDKLQMESSGTIEYVQGVQLLSYHLLRHESGRENFPKYLRRANKILAEKKVTADLQLWSEAGLNFCAFVTDLQEIVEQTKVEMETAKFSLRAAKSVSHEGQPKNEVVIPAFTKINVTQDDKLFKNLERALSKWSHCIDANQISKIPEWYSAFILRILVIVGEYCKLHHFSILEKKAWELAYKVANQLNNHRTTVYVVGRSISLWNVNFEWINTVNALAAKLSTLNNLDDDKAVAVYFLGLTNLYFNHGKYEGGVEFLQKVLSLDNINPPKNMETYLSSMGSIVRNYRFYSDESNSTKYMVYVARCFYTMLALMEYASESNGLSKEKQLYRLETLLSCTANLSLLLNSILSFKEISCHLTNRLKLAQASGAALRVAECLKYLCFIDLSRMQLDDCVVKLQGLEYILETEYTQQSQNSSNPHSSIDNFGKSGFRDSAMNSASPRLRNSVFVRPKFLEHGDNCLCYKCGSLDYQNLVLSGTHIRAQLYFSQGHFDQASLFFNGAFYLQRKLLRRQIDRGIPGIGVPFEDKVGKYPWCSYYQAIQYVRLLIDFSLFTRVTVPGDINGDGMEIVSEAVHLCEIFHLESHPIYFSARELLLEYQFCSIFKDESDFAKFTVPDPSAFDVHKLVYNDDATVLPTTVTPSSKAVGKKPLSIRRIKTPPLLKLTKIKMDLSEGEEDADSGSPKSSRHRGKATKFYTNSRSLRKKLEYTDSSPTPGSEKKSDLMSTYLDVPETVSRLEIGAGRALARTVSLSIKLFPKLSEPVNEIVNNEKLSDKEKIAKISNLVEQYEHESAHSKTDKFLDQEKKITGRKTRKSSRTANKLSTSEASSGVMKKTDPYCRTKLDFAECIKEEINAPEVVVKSRPDAVKASKDSNDKARYSSRTNTDPISTNEVTKNVEPQGRQRNSRRIEKADEIMKDKKVTSILETSDVIPASDNEENITSELRKKINNLKITRGTSSKVTKPRSKSAAVTITSKITIVDSDNSDIISFSDDEKLTISDSRRNIVTLKTKSRTSSRITKSQSQLAVATTSSKMPNVDDSDTEKPVETGRQRSNRQKSKSNDERECETNSELVVTRTESEAKKERSKRQASSRSKLKK
ncbi:uncharacterized protein LOC105687380 [Athalia rosae]|uniref:uncharacterized protein LOC105687380 n=1 Tax=Athalia rosae TaxID=37344 RepID=UPI002033CA1C|nr:uncharacterized protein LOC105687380 [Athalia rosae]